MGVIEASDRAWKGVQMTDERHGAAEWLRGIIDEYKANERSCPEKAKMFGIDCNHEESCLDCWIDKMKAIADRIDAERALPDGIEWPRFEDGGLVRIGDELEFEGKTMLVGDAIFYADGWALWCDREDMNGRLYGKYGERVKRPAPEVLDADGVPIEVGDTVWATYNGCKHIVTAVCSDGSLHPEILTNDGCMVEYDEGLWDFAKKVTHEQPDSWERIEDDAKLAPRDYLEKRGMNPEKTERIASMMADIVRRAKALAKAGEVE